MSSPYLNNLIIVGCLLSYTSIYFLGDLDGILFKKVCVVFRIFFALNRFLRLVNFFIF
jgi:hypothetical protein